MIIFNFIALSGAEQAKILVMVLFSIVLFVIIPYFRKSEDNKESTSKLEKEINSKETIRTDGYYLSRYVAKNNFNINQELYFFLFFTKNGFAGLMEIEDIEEWKNNNSDNDIKEIILETNKLIENKNPHILAKYDLKNNELKIKYYDPDDISNDDISNLLVYSEWYGTVLNDGLLLSLDIAYFNNALQDYVKENQLKNLKFKFCKIQ